MSAAAGSSSFNVTVLTGSGCTWTAVSSAPSWLTTSSTGTANGSVTFSVTLNSGPARTGTISVGDQTFTVTQSGCAYSINPGGLAVPKEGGQFNFNVSSNGCGWGPATTSAPGWVNIESGSGVGNGTVTFGVAPNTGPPRFAGITVAGLNFVIGQEMGCTWTISPTSVYVSAYGGTVYVNVQRYNQDCPIPVQSAVSWLTPIGLGCSDDEEIPSAWRYCWVGIYVGPNSSQDGRAGGLMVGGQPFIVYQGGAQP
jgi:hypothetical protein